MHPPTKDDEPVDALSSLSREIDPPASLERRIAARLREDGTIRTRRRWAHVFAAAAVIAVTFAAGWLAGRTTTSSGGDDGDRYALLLYGDVTSPSAELVAEYTAWARTARASGRRLTGERLERDSLTFGAASGIGDEPRGFFVFSAASTEDARGVAESHPHIRRGGRVVLKRIAQ